MKVRPFDAVEFLNSEEEIRVYLADARSTGNAEHIAQAEKTAESARKLNGMTDSELVLSTLPLVEALWWFIENVAPDDTERTTLFFLLRERYREEHQ